MFTYFSLSVKTHTFITFYPYCCVFNVNWEKLF